MLFPAHSALCEDATLNLPGTVYKRPLGDFSALNLTGTALQFLSHAYKYCKPALLPGFMMMVSSVMVFVPAVATEATPSVIRTAAGSDKTKLYLLVAIAASRTRKVGSTAPIYPTMCVLFLVCLHIQSETIASICCETCQCPIHIMVFMSSIFMNFFTVFFRLSS